MNKKIQIPASAKRLLKEAGLFVADILYNALIIIVLVVLIRTFLISPFRVVGSSMADTLASNEFILINKLSYRIGAPERGDPIVFKPPITGKYPHKFEELVIADKTGKAVLDLTDLETSKSVLYCKNNFISSFFFCRNRVNENDLVYVRSAKNVNETGFGWRYAEKSRITAEDVKNGTFVINGSPDASYVVRIYDASGPEYFVKRVIGIPGDVIKIENGRVYRKPANATEFKEVNEPYLNAQNLNHTYFSQKPSVDEFTVPEGKYFVLGDNRNHSNDSRSWFTPIDQKATPYVDKVFVSGKVLLVLWPPAQVRIVK